MSRVSSLFRLQELDTELARVDERLQKIQAALADSAEVRQARSALERAEASFMEARATSMSAEGEVSVQREKIDQNQQKLYGGAVTNPKELQDLQMEDQALHRHLETLEDRYLEALLAAEEAEETEQAARDNLLGVEAAQAAQREALVAERDELTSTREKLLAEREAAAANVSPEDQAHYDALRNRLAGLAVVLMSDGSCSACGLTLPASIRPSVRSGNEPVHCSQCGRILYGG